MNRSAYNKVTRIFTNGKGLEHLVPLGWAMKYMLNWNWPRKKGYLHEMTNSRTVLRSYDCIYGRKLKGLSDSVRSSMERLASSSKARKLLNVLTLRITEAIRAIGPFFNPTFAAPLCVLLTRNSSNVSSLPAFASWVPLTLVHLLPNEKLGWLSLHFSGYNFVCFRRRVSTRTRCGRHTGSYITSAPNLLNQEYEIRIAFEID